MKKFLIPLLLVLSLTACAKPFITIHETPKDPKIDFKNTQILTQDALKITYPGGLLISDGKIYISDLKNGEIHIYDENLSHISKLDVSDIELKYPNYLLFEDNKYIISDYGLQKVVVLDDSGKLINEFPFLYKTSNTETKPQIWDMEYFHGELYLASTEPYSILKMNLKNGEISVVSSEILGSLSKHNNNLYAADYLQIVNEMTTKSEKITAKGGINGIHIIENGKAKKLFNIYEGIAPIDFIVTPDKIYIYSSTRSAFMELDSKGNIRGEIWNISDNMEEFMTSNNLKTLTFRNMYSSDYKTFYLVFNEAIVKINI